MTEEERNDDPTYCTERRANKDMHMLSKGNFWVAKADAVARSRDENAN